MRWLFILLTLCATSTSATASKLAVPFQVEAVAALEAPGQVRIDVMLTVVSPLSGIQVDMVEPGNAILTSTAGVIQSVDRNNSYPQTIGTYYYDVSDVRQALRWKVAVSAESGGIRFKSVAFAVIGRNTKQTISPGRERAGAEEFPSK